MWVSDCVPGKSARVSSPIPDYQAWKSKACEALLRPLSKGSTGEERKEQGKSLTPEHMTEFV